MHIFFGHIIYTESNESHALHHFDYLKQCLCYTIILFKLFKIEFQVFNLKRLLKHQIKLIHLRKYLKGAFNDSTFFAA